jgi:hypothetical protein
MAAPQQQARAALWPGLIALAAATVYLIALLAVEKQALIISLLAGRHCRRGRRRLASPARRRKPVVIRA